MLKRLQVKNFTVFGEADFAFGPGLNVVVGTNGTGKSHVLKLGYAVLNNLAGRSQEQGIEMQFPYVAGRSNSLTKYQKEGWYLGDTLTMVFQTSILRADSLIRRGSQQPALIEYTIADEPSITGHLGFTVGGSGAGEMLDDRTKNYLKQYLVAPVFIPAKEILTLSWMLQASSQLKLPIEENLLELLVQLNRLPLQQHTTSAQTALDLLSQVLGGEVEAEGNHFHLAIPGQRPLEMQLLAEGLRKFGTLQRLLANGSLTKNATLFWDEPEANLNPALLKKLAAVLAALARQGFQIILATHSLFLLKQLHILSREKAETPLPIRYFGLTARPGEPTQVVMKEDFEHLPDIVALDEELEQADALTLVFAQDDAGNR